MRHSHSDCRENSGIAIGFIDGIIAACRYLVRFADLSPVEVQEALRDFANDEDVRALFMPVQPSSLEGDARHCRLCGRETTCVYSINLTAVPICESCGLTITKQEVASWLREPEPTVAEITKRTLKL